MAIPNSGFSCSALSTSLTPTLRTWTHHIKKLVSVQPDEGQWRLSLGRFRLHYDIYRQEVVLHYSGPRREETYHKGPHNGLLPSLVFYDRID